MLVLRRGGHARLCLRLLVAPAAAATGGNDDLWGSQVVATVGSQVSSSHACREHDKVPMSSVPADTTPQFKHICDKQVKPSFKQGTACPPGDDQESW